MANQYGIATVTATLQQLLDGTVAVDVPGAHATMISPDGLAARAPNPGVNVFLYQVVPNAAWRNEDLPTRTSSGAPASRPRTAIDLHYLLTFYGDDAKFESQRVMASAIRVLHARPLLSPAQIELAKTAYPQLLGGSDLAADVERVKLSQLPLNLEELSKLWSVFFQTTYRLSIAYRASAVLLEADDPGADALPVLRRTLSVETLHEPVVEQAVNASDDALVPRINRTAAGVYDISTLNATWRAVDGVTLHSADVRVGLEQSVGRRQRVALLLNELTAGDAHAYTFVARPRSDDGATITITAVDVIPGTYLLRGQVDGVDSPLDVVAGSYAGPTVTL